MPTLIMQVQVCVVFEHLSEYEVPPKLPLHEQLLPSMLPPQATPGSAGANPAPPGEEVWAEVPPPAGPVACEKHSTPASCERQQTSGELGVKGCQPSGQT
jgi:hypothetical protein